MPTWVSMWYGNSCALQMTEMQCSYRCITSFVFGIACIHAILIGAIERTMSMSRIWVAHRTGIRDDLEPISPGPYPCQPPTPFQAHLKHTYSTKHTHRTRVRSVDTVGGCHRRGHYWNGRIDDIQRSGCRGILPGLNAKMTSLVIFRPVLARLRTVKMHSFHGFRLLFNR